MSKYAPVMRDYLHSLVKELFPEPVVQVTGSHLLDVTLNRVNNKLVIHLLNAAGPHDNENILVHDEIPELNNINVSIRYPSHPKKVMLQPENRTLSFQYEKGKILCKIERLKIHEMIVVE